MEGGGCRCILGDAAGLAGSAEEGEEGVEAREIKRWRRGGDEVLGGSVGVRVRVARGDGGGANVAVSGEVWAGWLERVLAHHSPNLLVLMPNGRGCQKGGEGEDQEREQENESRLKKGERWMGAKVVRHCRNTIGMSPKGKKVLGRAGSWIF